MPGDVHARAQVLDYKESIRAHEKKNPNAKDQSAAVVMMNAVNQVFRRWSGSS